MKCQCRHYRTIILIMTCVLVWLVYKVMCIPDIEGMAEVDLSPVREYNTFVKDLKKNGVTIPGNVRINGTLTVDKSTLSKGTIESKSWIGARGAVYSEAKTYYMGWSSSGPSLQYDAATKNLNCWSMNLKVNPGNTSGAGNIACTGNFDATGNIVADTGYVGSRKSNLYAGGRSLYLSWQNDGRSKLWTSSDNDMVKVSHLNFDRLVDNGGNWVGNIDNESHEMDT